MTAGYTSPLQVHAFHSLQDTYLQDPKPSLCSIFTSDNTVDSPSTPFYRVSLVNLSL